MVISVVGSTSRVVYKALPVDDPTRRRPDIQLATTQLGWEPLIDLPLGLHNTVQWLRTLVPYPANPFMERM